MGKIHHHAVIVTGWNEYIDQAHEKAIELYEAAFEGDPFYDNGVAARLISEPVEGLINNYRTFFIAPDGSKIGWDTSDRSEAARGQFLEWLRESNLYLDYVVVGYGELGLQVESGDEKLESCNLKMKIN